MSLYSVRVSRLLAKYSMLFHVRNYSADYNIMVFITLFARLSKTFLNSFGYIRFVPLWSFPKIKQKSAFQAS